MSLTLLKIRNFAIIDKIEISFKPGFTVITGETGAGKSIIIDALNFSLGEKTSASMIRSGSEMALIECTFDCDVENSTAISFVKSKRLAICKSSVTLKRELYSSGRSKAWINGKSCSNSVLKEAGNLLVDLHGQHDHQSLLNEDNHISFMDAFGDYQDQIEKVSILWHKLKNLKEQRDILVQKWKINKEKRELWEFQYREIQTVNPKEGEYDELVKEKALLENSEKIHQISTELTHALYEGDDTLYQKIQEVSKSLRVLNDINGSFNNYFTKLEETQYLFQEISNQLSQYCNEVKYDPLRLEKINQRLYSLQQLMKKYGSTLKEVIDYKNEVSGNLNDDEGLGQKLSKLDKNISEAVTNYSSAALSLSQKREEQAEILEKELEKALIRLGIKGSRFKVRLEYVPDPNGWVHVAGQTYQGDSTGVDKIAFEISTNPGEPLKPLINIVSGGEVSRIMLALKSILAGRDQIPVLIFDEIDSGISGKIAHVVGEELRELGKVHQVICITHLPQIASLGDDHLSVNKVTKDERSLTQIERLSKGERVEEIAKLIGGKVVTETNLKQARELLG